MFILRRKEDGKYVSKPGSVNSYTDDRIRAVEYNTIEEADRNRCGNELIFFSSFSNNINYQETLVKLAD